jgi:acyl-coenzyme A thioesterase PaaI-like protein
MNFDNEPELIAHYVKQGWEHIEDDGFIGLIGPMFQKKVDDKLHFCFPTLKKHKNRNNVLQGGALLTFCDRVLGVVARAESSTPKTATIQLNMDFVHSVKIGEVVEASPVLVKDSKHLLFVKGTFYVNGVVVGEASGIWKKIKQIN